MNVYFAFYSKPFGGDIRNAKTHWSLPYVEFLTLAYTSAKAKLFIGKTILVTDKYGKELIIDTFNIPFDEVIVELDDCEKKPRFWASGKIYAYTKAIGKTFEPFMLLDNDAGFHTKPPAWFLDARYRCQHIHHDTNTIFDKMVTRLVSETPNVFPYDIYHEAKANIEGIKGGNAGIVIINDELLWQEFTRYTWALQESDFFDKIVKEQPLINPYVVLNYWNVVIEEILLYQLYRRLRYEQPQTIYEFNGLHIPKGTLNPTGYFHIWANKKKIEVMQETEAYTTAFIKSSITDNICTYFNVPRLYF